jgi:transcriptional regulator with XRE-family HTH domain
MRKRKESQELRAVFAANLRNLRQIRGISQERLAELSGLHRTYVSSVERAARNISIDNIERLAKALGATPEELLGEKK